MVARLKVAMRKTTMQLPSNFALIAATALVLSIVSHFHYNLSIFQTYITFLSKLVERLTVSKRMSGPTLFNDPVPEPYGFCEYLRFNVSELESEETYNPIQAGIDIYVGFKTYFRCWTFLNRSNNPFSDLYHIGSISLADVTVVLLMTIAWIVARVGLTNYFLVPFTKKWGMHPKHAEKFPESAFKTLSYAVLWFSAVYVTFFRGHEFFNNTLSLWKDCRYKWGPAPLDLRLMYGLEASFYFYSIYTAVYMDKWKPDSPVMILHHVVTLLLVIFSYAVSHLKIGILIFVLNDISDVLLELAKSLVYLSVKGARFAKYWKFCGQMFSFLFTLSWLVFRNLFHLTKVWRSSSYGSFFSMPYLPPPLYLFFNVLLGSLYLFYMYWFYFIIYYMVRIATGQMKEPNDPRDELADQEFEKEVPSEHEKTITSEQDSDGELNSSEQRKGSCPPTPTSDEEQRINRILGFFYKTSKGRKAE